MKLKGEFILREIMGETIAIPIGDSLLNFNGMLCLNEVGEEIWKGLQAGKSKEQILDGILDEFDVTREEAVADLDSFLNMLKESDLLED
jgi:hypothetical protein